MKMKMMLGTALVMMLGMGTMGCGDACDDAADKFEECFPDAETTEDGDAECTEQAECQADCLTSASCDDIVASTTGEDNSYAQCLAACQ